MLHLLAMVSFLGGILACIVLGAARHLTDPPLYGSLRRIVGDLTMALIVPGMWASIVTGFALSWNGRLGLFRRSWVGAKQVLGVLIAMNALLLILPAFLRIGALLQLRTPDMALAARLQVREDAFGAVNLLLALLAMTLAVWRPGSPQASSADRPLV